MRKPLFPLSLLASLILVSCTTILNNLPGVYTLDIQQGNMVDQAMIDQLRPNMNKRQVLYIMGSPMLADPFHQNRWDYIYSFQPGREPRLQKRITLLFANDRIVGIQGDFKPSTSPVADISNETTVDLPVRNIEKTLWEKITGAAGHDDIDDANDTGRTSPSSPSGTDQPL